MVVNIEKIIEGDGKSYPKEGNVVEVHYQGMLPDGTVFDDTRKRERPFRFRLKTGEVRIPFTHTPCYVRLPRLVPSPHQVISGWDDGVSQMSLGERAKITMSADSAYGERGFPGLIPPNSSIIFIVDLISFR